MSARARNRHNRSRGSVGKKVLLGFGVVFAVVGIALGSAALWVLDIARSAPSIDTLKPIDSGANSEVFAADGSRLGFIQAEILREPVEIKEIPETLQRATIAIEDEKFYEHDGVDVEAIVRAGVENFEAGEVRQGASTITQQLVRNLYIAKPEDTIERKIIEAQMAMDYEERYTKDEILERYLNTASYGTNAGRTAVGVKSASEVFFNKDVSQLNVGEAALLAGLPQAPSEYNPFSNPDRATTRRNLVLKAMADQGFLSQGEYAKWAGAGLGLKRGYRYEEIEEQYFFDYVQEELIKRYGVQKVRLGGLKVYTTIEPKLQAVARSAIAGNYVPSGAATALVSTDTATGEIKAMASSATYDVSQFNLAAQGQRQPGSAFKPFALAAAIDQGADPDSTYYSAPSTITLDMGIGAPPWTVSGGGGASMSLRQATANSINTVFAQLVLDIGPEAMNDMARSLGITAKLNDYPAEVLGGLEQGVSVLEMSNAYASFANGGVHHKPTAVRRVEFPDGKVDTPEKPQGTRVLTDGVAYEVADVMKGALEYGTAAGLGIGCPASGKTGTTEAQADVWFVGYTPQVSTAVWMGNPNDRTAMPGYGADLAAPIWRDYMLTAATQPCEDFPAPTEPADLSSFFGDHTVSSDYGQEAPTSEPLNPDDADDIDSDVESGDADGDGAPDDLYAPGVDGNTNPADRGNRGGGRGNGAPGGGVAP